MTCIFHSHGYKLMSQDSREKFGVKSQMQGGGEERKERKDMLKARQSRGCCFALLFYVYSKHLRSCRDGQLT